MPGPNDLWAWLQSLQGQGSGQNAGPGAGNVGPVNGFIPDPTQQQPNGGGPAVGASTPLGPTGPNSLPSPSLQDWAKMLWPPGPDQTQPPAPRPSVPWRVPPANEGQVVAGQQLGPMPWRVPPANEGPRRLAPAPTDPYGPTRANAPIDPYGLTRANAPIDPYGLTPPAPNPAPAPIDPYDRRGPVVPPAQTPAGPLASPDAAAAPPMKRRAGAPNLGYYQPNDRFVSIDRPNAPAGGGGGMARGGPPQMSALNLAGLFNRGQQPGVNPNVPAANAQPVSAAAPGGQIGPTPYGPNTPRLNPSGLLALLGGNQPPNGYGSVPVPYPPQRPLGY